LAYTQAPPMTEEETESLLKEAQIARFCSLNEDGTIHAAPVWYKYENKRIIVGTPEASRKARNVKRNENVTILIDVDRPPMKGVIIYGKATVAPSPFQIPEAVSFFEKYMPTKEAEGYAKELLKLTKWVKITVKPERIASFDYSKDEAYMAGRGKLSTI